MIQVLLILTLLACVLLVCIVLIQNPKGGGLSSNFSASSQLMGVKKTGDFLEKGTWGLAIFLMVVSMAINVAAKGGSATSAGTQQVDRTKEVKAPVSQGPALPSSSTPMPGAAQPSAPAK